MKKIKTALISVSDKKNLKPLLNVLKKNNIKIISSGGTYKEIKN
jgi:phosphoribosylaminoimidazolecarboxamide formyltransferase/IMP cyclohydrolase